MTETTIELPQTRSWRDIPQEVKSRAMSTGGKKRVALSGLRVVTFVAIAGITACGAWQIAGTLRESPTSKATVAASSPVKHLELRTRGVLDPEWLRQTLALPKNATLMELDLAQLRARLLVTGQVESAEVARKFPDTLAVELSERLPVVRWHTPKEDLLVARDGVAFAGFGYKVTELSELPWVEGAPPPAPGEAAKVSGMTAVTDLLAQARYNIPSLYARWRSVSVARLALDNELIVNTQDGPNLVFSTVDPLYPQLAKIDAVWSKLESLGRLAAAAELHVNGDRDVVMTPVRSLNGAVPVTAAGSIFSIPSLSNPQPKRKT